MTSTRLQARIGGAALFFQALLPIAERRAKQFPKCDSGQIAINPLPASAKQAYPAKWEATTLNRYT